MHTFERLLEMKASGIIQRRVLFPYCQPVNRIVELPLDAKRRELSQHTKAATRSRTWSTVDCARLSHFDNFRWSSLFVDRENALRPKCGAKIGR